MRLASVWNRDRTSSSRLPASSTFTATSRRGSCCSYRKTSAKPPRPSTRTGSYPGSCGGVEASRRAVTNPAPGRTSRRRRGRRARRGRPRWARPGAGDAHPRPAARRARRSSSRGRSPGRGRPRRAPRRACARCPAAGSGTVMRRGSSRLETRATCGARPSSTARSSGTTRPVESTSRAGIGGALRRAERPGHVVGRPGRQLVADVGEVGRTGSSGRRGRPATHRTAARLGPPVPCFCVERASRTGTPPPPRRRPTGRRARRHGHERTASVVGLGRGVRGLGRRLDGAPASTGSSRTSVRGSCSTGSTTCAGTTSMSSTTSTASSATARATRTREARTTPSATGRLGASAGASSTCTATEPTPVEDPLGPRADLARPQRLEPTVQVDDDLDVTAQRRVHAALVDRHERERRQAGEPVAGQQRQRREHAVAGRLPEVAHGRLGRRRTEERHEPGPHDRRPVAGASTRERS